MLNVFFLVQKSPQCLEHSRVITLPAHVGNPQTISLPLTTGTCCPGAANKNKEDESQASSFVPDHHVTRAQNGCVSPGFAGHEFLREPLVSLKGAKRKFGRDSRAVAQRQRALASGFQNNARRAVFSRRSPIDNASVQCPFQIQQETKK